MILPRPQICLYPVNIFVLLRRTCLLFMTAPAIHMCRCVVRIYVGVHPPHAAFDDSTAYVRNITTTTIPPFRLLQSNYSSTILGIQYDDSAVIIHAIPQTPLTILTALMPLNKSADTLWRFCGYPLTIPRKSFGDSAEILWRFRRWSADYSRSKTTDIVKFLLTCTVCKHVYVLVFTVLIVHFVILHHYGSQLWLVHCVALTILHEFKLVLCNAVFSCCILADVVKCLYLPCAISYWAQCSFQCPFCLVFHWIWSFACFCTILHQHSNGLKN